MLPLEDKLREHFGFREFRHLQREIISELLAGNSAVAILPTGAGKSLCYQLPAMLLPGVTIVISPLISLMKDQTDSLVARGIPALAINSHDTPDEGRSKLAALAGGQMKLVFVAPERLQNPAFLAACARVRVSLLAVDEAHCVSQWGHDFRPEYQQIPAFHASVGQPPLLALTATARPTVQQDLVRQLGLSAARLFRDSADRPNLWIGLEACQTAAEREAVIAHLLREQPGSAIVYVTSRREAETLSASLAERLGEPVGCYHAGLAAEQRTAVQNQFMSDLVRVVVATSAFGMGIDKPDIRTVLHAGVSDSLEAYFQEIGRAGRDGRPARCVMVLLPGRDIKMREYLLAQSTDPHAAERFRQLRSYVYLTGECRRSFLLRYFGEQRPPQAEACCSTCHPLLIPGRAELVGLRKARKGRGAAVPAVQAFTAEAAAAAPQLLEHLKHWRRRKAADLGVPAFVVFGDRDLAGVAAAAPTTLLALSACRGIGPAKLQMYGEELLAEIAGFTERTPEPISVRKPDTEPEPGSERTPDAEPGPGSERTPERAALVARTGALFVLGHSAPDIATQVGRSEGTVWQYLLAFIAADQSDAWKQAVLSVLPRAAYRDIAPLLRQQADGPLKPIFERLAGRYTYDQIRVARAVLHRQLAAKGNG